MKRIFIIICLIFSCFSCVAFARAADVNTYNDLADSYIDEISRGLSGEAKRYMKGIDVKESNQFANIFQAMMESILRNPHEMIKKALMPIVKVLVVVIICGCSSSVIGGTNEFAQKVVNISGALSITGIILGDVHSALSLCINAINDLDVFSKALIPVMAGSVMMTGSTVSNSGIIMSTMVIFDTLITFTTRVLMRFVYVYIAMMTVNSALSNDSLKRLCDLIKSATLNMLKFFLTIFVAYISISGAITSNVGSIAVKTARFAVSSSVPVVGGIISDATESFLSGMILLKNSIGIFGMMAIVCICFLPLIQIGINYILFKIGCAVISPVGTDSLSSLIDGIGNGFSMMFGMLGTCASVLFAEIIVSIVILNPRF